MGYTTTFEGALVFSRQLTLEELEQIERAIESPPEDSPGRYCDWRIINYGRALDWNPDTEKFYDYTEWLEFLVERFFAPWGVKLQGEITWQGEDSSDRGRIVADHERGLRYFSAIENPCPECNGSGIQATEEPVEKGGR